MIQEKFLGIPEIAKKKKNLILVALVLAIFVPYADASLVAAAGTTIVTDIGGMELFSMLFSGKTLTNVIFMLLVGKLADKFGRRNVFVIGIVIAIIGYLCTGFSTDMTQMIAWRVFTGISAGLCGGLVYVMTGDIYKGKEYGTAYIAQLIAANAAFIGGPILGGVLATYYSWQWCFWIMVPIFAIVLISVLKNVPNYRIDREGTKLDVRGIVLFSIGMVALIFALATVVSYFPWGSPIIISCLAVAAVLLVIFFILEAKVEQRVAIFPVSMLKNRAMSSSIVGQITMTLNSVCLMAYIPYYVQNVMGQTPTTSGTVLATIYVAIAVCGLFITRQLAKNQKYRFWCNFTVLGESIGLILVCIFLSPSLPIVGLIAICITYGCFASVESTAFIMAAQSSFSPSQMAAGTACVIFSQTFASLLGTTVGGTILNSSENAASGVLNIYIFAAIVTVIGAVIVVTRMPGKKYIEEIKAKALKADETAGVIKG